MRLPGRTGTLSGAGLVRLVRALVVLARRVRSAGVLAVGVAVHGGSGAVGRRGEGISEVAQPLGSEIEGFHVRAGLLQGPQRRHVECRPRLGAGVFVGVRERDKELLGDRGLLVRHDVVVQGAADAARGAQPGTEDGGGDDRAVVEQRDAWD